jgi:hypothetical protein
MPTRKFSDAAKSALLFYFDMPCGGSAFGTPAAALLVADESASERLNLLEQNHTS